MKDIPAFPLPTVFDEVRGLKYTYDTGMTLRDYFAGQALMGMLPQAEDGYFEHRAVMAYKYADALIAERSAGKGGENG